MINQKQIREIGINYRRDTLCCDDFSWFVKIDNINFSQLCNVYKFIQGLVSIIG
jgi:hypothetical protein